MVGGLFGVSGAQQATAIISQEGQAYQGPIYAVGSAQEESSWDNGITQRRVPTHIRAEPVNVRIINTELIEVPDRRHASSIPRETDKFPGDIRG